MATRQQLEALVDEQRCRVRDLKKSGATVEEITAAVAELNLRKAKLSEETEQTKDKSFKREGFEDLMKRRFFYAPAFEIYGGVAGLYDYGPTGCAIMNSIQQEWRRHFILEDNILEINCPAMTPFRVLDASGHAKRFADIMVRDVKTGDCHRADHLLEDVMAAKMKDPKATVAQVEEFEHIKALADTYSKEELKALFEKFEIKSPITGNDLSDPIDFNMMFKTEIGPTGDNPGFLRPELAQGIFVAFKRLYDFNGNKLPFGGAQIGVAYRNEISPRSGLLRVREFPLAEIEYFLDPDNKDHPKFQALSDTVLPLYTATNQEHGQPLTKMTIGEAVSKGVVANETLGYYICRIYQFLMKIGANPDKLRFRQHMRNEMAHYACDCWDCELLTSYGWIECVGCADRSCYDLQQHAQATNQELMASEPLKTPIIRDRVVVEANKGLLGRHFKNDAKLLFKHFEHMSNEEAEALEADIQKGSVTVTVDGKHLEITPEMVKIKRKQEKIHERKFVPSVVEPSFGLGRIIYSVLEHSYECREGDEQRQWLRLSPLVAPVKCSLLPLSNKPDFDPFLNELSEKLTEEGVTYLRDASGTSIGRRYARTDEIGVPFGVTIDFESLENRTVTMRDRNTMTQVRMPMDDVPKTIAYLSRARLTWDQVVEKYGLCQTGSQESS
eukprot:m.28803 g.28803  ORF g.28803 m.28803 type:complete len:670 (-) comp10478_c0_seq1:240-2249(-)